MDPDALDELCVAEESTSEEETSPDGLSRTHHTACAHRVQHGGVDDPWLLDFSANVNPRTPAGVSGVYESALSMARSYPPDDYPSFRAAAAEYVGCEATQVIPTAGGLAAIRLAVATTIDTGDEVLVPYPSFGEYAREVRLQGGTPTFVHYRDVLETDPSSFVLAIVCTPNNPTGDAYDPEKLRAYAERCRRAGTPLLVDEAFLGFTDLDSLAGRPGVIVARSLTKLFGLPGLRSGFAVATDQFCDRLDTARPAWGVGAPACEVGAYCMAQTAFVEETRDRIREERARMRERLESRFDVCPSDAPFLLLEPEGVGVDDVLSSVREHEIAVRDARTFRGLDRHVRVAVRLPHENDQLLDALDV